MVRRWGKMVGFFIIIAMALPIMAQEKDNTEPAKAPDKPLAFYKLDLSVREMDGSKVVNTRTYTLDAKGDDWSRFRVGSRIPVTTGTFSNAADSKPINVQWQYLDVGLNADCHIVESDSGPTLSWTIELSSVAPEMGAAGQPIIRNVRSQGATLLFLNKPTVLSTADDLSSTHKFVFEMTATQIK
jgi:hypothetical protein